MEETPQAPVPEKETKARERARIILEVRSGKMTATDGAHLLGVSRQRFYEWEDRALSAMTEALQDREAGRPEKPVEPQETTKLKQRVKDLEQENLVLRQSATVRDALYPFPEWRPNKGDSKKKQK